MSWFGRKKRRHGRGRDPQAPLGPEDKVSRGEDDAADPFPGLEGDVTALVEDSESTSEPDTGSFRVALQPDTAAQAIVEPESVEDPHYGRGGLMQVTVAEPTREERLVEAVAGWRHSLSHLDSAHDFLSDMRAGRHLDLTHSHPQGLAHLLAARDATRLSSLVREPEALAHALEQAHHIREIAQTHAEERGLTTCYLGIGEASWREGLGRLVHAPILVRPVTVKPSGLTREDAEINLDAAVDLNPMLLRALREEGVLIDARALLELTRSLHGFDPQPVLDAFRSLGEPLPGFRVGHALVIGTLEDASSPLIEDFDATGDDLVQHPLIAALAGDENAISEVREPADTREGHEREDIAAAHPDAREMYEALGQRPALAVHIPAGSDCVAPLTALVAEMLADGKRVLVLSPRASRLSAMRTALVEQGLEDVMLSLIPDPHVHARANDALVRSLAQASSFVAPVDVDPPEGLREAREVLTGHVEAMHRIQEPWGVSAHQAINALADFARMRPTPRTSVRLRPHVAERVMKQREEYRALMREGAESGAIHMRVQDSPWCGAAITSDTQAQRALELVNRLHDQLLPALGSDAHDLGGPLGSKAPATVKELVARTELLEQMRDLFTKVKPEVFGHDIEAMLAARADRAYRDTHNMPMSWAQRRRWKHTARGLVRPVVTKDEIVGLLEGARELRGMWRTHLVDADAPARIPDSLDQMRARAREAQKVCDELAVLLAGTATGGQFYDVDLVVLGQRVRELRRGQGILDVLPRRTSLLRTLEFEGLGELVEDLRERDVSPELVVSELDLSWWISVLEFIARAEPTLSQYDGTKLSQVAERFRRLDAQYMAAGRYRVRGIVDEKLVETMKRFPDTSRAAIRELNASGASSVKDTASKYQDIVFRARPLWLASPYMVPQMIPAGEHFDVVILTDAAALPTAAAVAALARARQAVIVGDPFEYAHPRSKTSSLLLDDVSGLAPVLRMMRDQHAATGGVRRFVAALARDVDERWAHVCCPPSPEAVDEDSFVYVPDARGPVGGEAGYIESTSAELRRVSDLVIYHARHTPERSLGIVTLTPAHARSVYAAVMEAIQGLPDLSDFFDPDKREPFAVVPVEQSGGFSREDIIVSFGFGLTPHERLLHRFGPLSHEQGRRALMSALTKARSRTCVVSGVRASDIDPERLTWQGERDFLALLEFLEAGMPEPGTATALKREDAHEQPSDEPVEHDSQVPTPSEPTQPIEDARSREGGRAPGIAADPTRALIADLADRLWRMGYEVDVDYGLTAEKVELAVGHPELAGHFLVAVMTDGPKYREIADQRERDRLAAERLEAAGWTVERVWSWALFIDPEGEAERVKKSIDRALVAYHDRISELRLHDGGSLRRLPRPKVPAGHPLSFYGPEDFDAVVRYICSDGKARMAEQLAAEVRDFLAFENRFVLLDVSISAAIRRYSEAQGT